MIKAILFATLLVIIYFLEFFPFMMQDFASFLIIMLGAR